MLADNGHAIAFYRRNGFRDGGLDEPFLRMNYVPTRARDEGILTAGPSISPREVAYATDAARHGWNSRWSTYITDLEREFADYVGAEYAIATSSCTGALHLAMLAAGLGPGDEAIVPEQTWVATAKAVQYVGATPVFADVQRDGWCLDPESVERAITGAHEGDRPGPPLRPPGRHGRNRAIAAATDCADRGRGPRDRRRGARPPRRCARHRRRVQLQGAKLLVTGEGGMFVTNDPDVYARAYKAWDIGVERSGGFWIDAHGAQVQVAERRRRHRPRPARARRPPDRGEARDLRLVRRGAGRRRPAHAEPRDRMGPSIYWMTSVLVDPACGIDRTGSRARSPGGIDTRPTFPLISTYPIWDERRAVAAPVARRIGERGVNLRAACACGATRWRASPMSPIAAPFPPSTIRRRRRSPSSSASSPSRRAKPAQTASLDPPGHAFPRRPRLGPEVVDLDPPGLVATPRRRLEPCSPVHRAPR